MRRLAVVAAGLLLLLGACSDADEAVEPDGVPSVVTTTPPATVASPSTVAPSTTDDATPTTTDGVPPPTTSTTTTTTVPLVPLDELQLTPVKVLDGLSQPVFVSTPVGDDRLFVVDQPGRIWVIEADEAELFLDIRDDVLFRGERGLLGLAFHPDYADNGLFYLNYTDNGGDTVVAEFAVSDAPNVAESRPRRILLEIDQPASNHNGGMIAFGPDGYLWVGTGDGGGANDRFGQGQRADTLLAALLRIDVAGDPYAIPDANPFNDGDDGAAEVWGYGLRNPWRFSFDGERIYIADVGQNRVEEIDAVPVSAVAPNFGWPIMEGSDCFARSSCSSEGLVLPVAEYTHSDGCSVTGGYVYRGRALPELDGHYFYGDYCSGWVRSLLLDDAGSVVHEQEWFPRGTFTVLTSFGTDADGELYVTSANGSVWRIERAPA